MRLKKIVACTIAATMVLGSLSMVSAETSYDDVTIGDGFSANTGEVTLSGDFDVTYTFHDVCNGTNNWENYIVEMNNADGVYLDVRSDNYGWFAGQSENVTLEFGDGSADWNAWLVLMQAGQDCTANIVREGGNVVVTVTAAGETFTATAYVSEYADGCDLTLRLTGENCTISNVSISGTADLALSADNTTMLIGATQQLTISNSAVNNDAVFTSSDETVATVDESGVVTAVAVGDVTITATNGDYTASVDIHVTDQAIALTGITAEADSTDLTVGGTATITVTKVPSDTTEAPTYTYSSSDESVVTVADGVVTAVAAGTATVTVSAVNEAGETLTATVDFTVTEANTDADDDSEDDTGDGSTVDSDSYTEIVEQIELADLSCGDFWGSFTQSLALVENESLAITGTTTNLGADNWCNMVFALFSSDDGNIYAADSEEGAAANYVEYFVGRVDNYGWGTATYEVVSAPDDWDAWLAETQAGLDFTITAVYVDGTIQITCECGDCVYVVTYEVEDPDLTYYIALTGQECELTNLVATWYTASADDINGDLTGTDSSASDDEGTGTTSSPQTGDVLPIVAVLVALCGCAVILVASKRRRV